MRKFLLAAFVAILCAASASAQISGLRTSDGLKRLGVFRAASGSIYYDPITHDIFLSIPSTNRFDDNLSFYLGRSKDSALQTLDDLDAFMESAKKGDMFAFDTCYGEHHYEGVVTSGLGEKGLNFFAEDKAGVIPLAQYELIAISDIIRLKCPDDASEAVED